MAPDSRAVAALLVFGAVWFALVAGEWAMRFAWFKWHESLFIPSAANERGPFAPMLTMTNPAVRGGDLTTLMGPAPDVNRYKEWKPAATNYTDEFGFRNEPPTAGRHYPVITVGDSFMVTAPRMNETFAGQLAEISGLPVYNYAYEGRGPTRSIVRLLLMGSRLQGRPAVVIWGLLERNVSPVVFAQAAQEIRDAESRSALVAAARRMGRGLAAGKLRTSLPDTSVLAFVSSRSWTGARNRLVRRPPSVVVPSGAPIAGHDVLFYQPGVHALTRGMDASSLDDLAESVDVIRKSCERRGLALLVLLIPDKERVYRAHLPAGVLPVGRKVSPSILTALEKRLRERDVPVVNLLPVFSAAAAEGELLYWTDDTHWNSRGVALAAETAMPALARLIEPQEN